MDGNMLQSTSRSRQREEEKETEISVGERRVLENRRRVGKHGTGGREDLTSEPQAISKARTEHIRDKITNEKQTGGEERD